MYIFFMVLGDQRFFFSSPFALSLRSIFSTNTNILFKGTCRWYEMIIFV